MRRFWSNSSSISFRTALEISIFLVTFIIIVFFSILIHQTTELICNNDGARQFIERIRTVPLEAWKISTVSIFLFILLALSSLFRSRCQEKILAQMLFSSTDLILCVAIIFLLNFSYRSIMFIAILNAMRFIPNTRMRYAFVTLFVLTYMLADFDIVSLKFRKRSGHLTRI
jgi:hypothetical protein